MTFKRYQRVWATVPGNSTPLIGVVVEPGSAACWVEAPESADSYVTWIAQVEGITPATEADVAAAPGWVLPALQRRVTQRELINAKGGAA